jgi:hypothetical protein
LVSLFRKLLKSKPQDYGPTASDYAHSILASQGPSPAAEESARQDMGINIHTIEDERILKMLDALSVVGGSIPNPKYDPSNTTSNEPEFVEISYPRPWAMALRVAVSKVNACRFLTKEEAVTTKLKLRNEVEKIKLTMSHSDLELFGAFINIVVAVYAEPAIDDSIDGQKMLGLKVQSREWKVKLQDSKS